MSGLLKSGIGSSHSGLAGRTYSCYLGQLLGSVKMQRWWQSGLATILSEATTTTTEEHSLGTREQTHTISTIVTFSSQRERKCCYQEDISKDLGKRALLGWLVETVLSSAGVYGKEFLKNSITAEHPEEWRRVFSWSLALQNNSTVLNKANAKCIDFDLQPNKATKPINSCVVYNCRTVTSSPCEWQTCPSSAFTAKNRYIGSLLKLPSKSKTNGSAGNT